MKNYIFELKSVENIKQEIIGESSKIFNFPKSVTFPFDDLYKQVVTKIKTLHISSECILYNSVEANNETKEFSDKSYWNENITEEEIKNYWIIGQNGQGDLWIMGIDNRIYFYDLDTEELSKQNFTELNIDFGQWLQFAYLNKQLDAIYNEDKYNEMIGKDYKEKLMEISKELLENYPYDIP